MVPFFDVKEHLRVTKRFTKGVARGTLRVSRAAAGATADGFLEVSRHIRGLPRALGIKKELDEESVLLVSVTKWFLIATAIGAIVGLTTVLFLRALEWSIAVVDGRYWLLPFGLVATAFLLQLAPKADAYTTDKVIGRIHAFKEIPPFSGVKAFLGSILTIATGGSAGREAPAADIGASAGSALAKLLRFTAADGRKLTICSISAAFAAVFGTPIAGAVFGMEVLFVGTMLYDVLLPCFVAGITAYGVAQALGATHRFHPVEFVPAFSESFLLSVLVAGILFGLIAFLFIEAQRRLRRFVAGTPLWLAALAGSLLLLVLGEAFGPASFGLGTATIEGTLTGASVVWYAFLLKIAFTVITLTMGGAGGVVTPLLFIGATAGSVIGSLLGADPGVFAAIGLVAVLAGATNTPLAGSILAIELFDTGIAPYAAVACIIAFLVTGHRSVYPSQVLAIRKSPSIRAKTGKTMGETRVRVVPRSGGLLRLVDHVGGKGLRDVEELLKRR